MLAFKYRPAKEEDLSEIRVLTEGVIRRLKCDDEQIERLLGRYSRDKLEAWILSEDIDALVGTYMGFVIGVCFVQNGNVLGLFVGRNNKDNDVESSLWSYARDVTLAKEHIGKLSGEVLTEYVDSIKKNNKVNTTDLGMFSSVSEILDINSDAVYKAQQNLKDIDIYTKKDTNRIARMVFMLFIFLLWLTDVPAYLFNPNWKLEKIASESGPGRFDDTPKPYSEWQVDFLLWRGAQPVYSIGDNRCYGAFPISIMWFNPKLLNHITRDMTQAEKKKILLDCDELLSSYHEDRKQNVIKAIGYKKGA
ncbi:MAG: hypothetical protein OQJ95_08930 [Kangiella sp.]|jgi:hypothetical protein|nr:hypothetical protein [Kangiella sp.]